MLKLLDRIVSWQLFKAAFFGALLFSGVVFSLKAELLAQIAASEWGWQWVRVVFKLLLPFLFPVILPVSALLAGIFCAQHLVTTRSIWALPAVGIPLLRILRSAFTLFVIFTFLQIGGVFFILPQMTEEAKGFLKKRIEENPLLLLSSPEFYRKQGWESFKNEDLSRIELVIPSGKMGIEVLLAQDILHKKEGDTVYIEVKDFFWGYQEEEEKFYQALDNFLWRHALLKPGLNTLSLSATSSPLLWQRVVSEKDITALYELLKRFYHGLSPLFFGGVGLLLPLLWNDKKFFFIFLGFLFSVGSYLGLWVLWKTLPPTLVSISLLLSAIFIYFVGMLIALARVSRKGVPK